MRRDINVVDGKAGEGTAEDGDIRRPCLPPPIVPACKLGRAALYFLASVTEAQLGAPPVVARARRTRWPSKLAAPCRTSPMLISYVGHKLGPTLFAMAVSNPSNA